MRLGFLFGTVLFLLPVLASAGVVVNEVAWMGTEVSSSDEWMELYNNGSEDVDLTDWILTIQDKKDILLSGSISAGSYFLIERSDDSTLPDIPADLVFSFGTGLTNTGAVLTLKNDQSVEVDKINALEGWPAGDNSTKETMQKSGLSWITALGTPRSQNVVSLLEIQEEQEGVIEQNFDVGWLEYVPPEERPGIKAYAGKDKILVVGVLGDFRGEAYGLEDELLDNARYLWNFGDGVLGEGKGVSHSYQYPGTYAVVLDVSSGGYSCSDKLIVQVMPNQVYISEIKTGVGSFIELHNPSKYEVDLYSWRIEIFYQSFTFAQNSFISPGAYLVIPISSSGLFLPEGQGLVELSYPRSFLADSFNYGGFLKEGESFSRKNSALGIYVVPETPGEKNLEPEIKKEEVKQVIALTSPETGIGKIEIAEEELAEEASGVENQTANVVIATGNSAEKIKIFYYFLGVLGLSIFAGFSIYLIRRQSGA